jgi:hypothetical protein
MGPCSGLNISAIIGLEEVGDGIWSIHFCRVLLARLDERDYVIRG